MKNNIQEIIAAAGLVLVLVLLINSMSFYMSNMVLATCITVLVLCYSFFVLFVVRRKPQDEREETHERFAGRIAFMTGTFLMLVGVIVQSLSHQIDVWLVAALTVMIVSKLVAETYSARNK